MWRACILLGLLAVSACGGGAEDDAPVADDLAGRSFVSTGVRGPELVPGSQVTIAFEPRRMSAHAGCNTLAGAWSIADGRLRTGELVRTLIGCEPALETQDEWLRSFLADAPRLTLDGADLTLASDDATIELREGAPAGALPPIAGTTWRLTAIGGRDGAPVRVPADVEAPTLLIGEDGAVELFAGCNRGSGAADVRDDGFVEFGPLALTRKACDEAATRVEAAMTAILRGRVVAGFDGEGRLMLAREGRHLVFAPSP